MTSSRPIRNAAEGRSRGGFTLVEVLVASALSAMVLAAIFATYIALAKSGHNLGQYAAMESEARVSLEKFAQDVRQASSIKWNSAQSITLSVQGASINYALVKVGKDLQFHRDGAPIVRGVVENTFSLIPYTIAGHEIPFSVDGSTKQPAPTAAELADAERMTKQLQLSLQAARSGPVVARTTNMVLSARFILRNKRVT